MSNTEQYLTNHFTSIANPNNNRVVVADPGMTPFDCGDVFTVAEIVAEMLEDIDMFGEMVFASATNENKAKYRKLRSKVLAESGDSYVNYKNL